MVSQDWYNSIDEASASSLAAVALRVVLNIFAIPGGGTPPAYPVDNLLACWPAGVVGCIGMFLIGLPGAAVGWYCCFNCVAKILLAAASCQQCVD